MKSRIQCVQTQWNRGSSRSARRAAAEQPARPARPTGVATDRAAGAAVRVQPARGVPDGGQHIRLEARPGRVLLMSGEYCA